jgi:LuxR family maltose regulon positive regulatory protein
VHDRLDETPRTSASTLPRPHLRDQLTAGLDKNMTLIVAPAGYGKTMLLLDWVTTLDVPVAWVALTERDNDPGHFVRSVVGAVTKAIGDHNETIDERLAFVAPSSAPLLIEEWVQHPSIAREFVLVIDDLHVLVEETAVQTAQRLVEAAPSTVQLCIASRHDPPLAVARLRMDGQLAELRQADLAFTIDEVTALLATTSIDLSENQLASLHARTEGWPAAVRLALISMTQSGDPERVVRDLAGTNRIIGEYLVEEVLAEMEPARQQFLLRTSILDEITVEIAQILTGRIDGVAMLEELVAAGEFTTQRSVGRFSYHRLLRDLLRARLRDVDPELFVDLHRQAAVWYWEHDDSVRAIKHAISSGENEQATAWLGEAARALANTGHGTTIVELSGRLLDNSIEPSRLLLLTRMWSLYNIMAEPVEVDRLLDRLISALTSDEPDGDQHEITHGGDPRTFVDASALPWLLGLQARAIGDVDALLALDRPENLPSPSGRVEGFAGEGYLWIEQYDKAEPLFNTFLEHANHDQYAPSMVHSTGSLAFALVGQGRLNEADPLIARTSELIDRFGIAGMINCQYAQLVDGWLRWERENLAASESILLSAQEFADESGDVPIAVQHAILRSRTRWSLGDRDGARALLDRAAEPTSGRIVAGHFADRIAHARATLDLLEGDPLAAERWIPNWRERLAKANERERLTLSRLAVALGETANVLVAPSTDETTTNALHNIEASKLAAAYALADGNRKHAVRSLTAAMSEAMRVGAKQRVVDEQQVFASIFAAAVDASGFASAHLEALDGPRSRNGGARTPEWFIEELTERELEVLEQLTTHLSYPEIADLLYVSVNTVKSHVKAIFRKLAVTRRTDAVRRALEFGLLSE